MLVALLACTPDPSKPPAETSTSSTSSTPTTVTTSTPSVPCDSPTGTLHEQHLKVDGEKRYYLLHVPDSYDCAEPAPVLFDLHGTASYPPEEAYALDGAIAGSDADGYLLVRPRSRSSDYGGYEIYRWDQNPGDPELNAEFLVELLADLETRYAIAPDRVYVMGFSSGTNQTALAAADPDSPFRGFGHVGGGEWSVDQQLPLGRFYLHTPFRDYMRAYHHELVGELADAGVDPADIFERQSYSGHDLYDWVYPELFAFLDRGETPDVGEADPRWHGVPGAPTEELGVFVDAAGVAWFTGADGTVTSWDGDVFAPAAIEGSSFLDEPSLTSICLTADGRGAAVGNGTVLWTEDGGATFRHLDPLDEPGPPMFGYALWMGVGCSADQVLGVGYWSAGLTDDGATWSDAVMGTAYRAQAQAVAKGPSGTWMAAGYYGYLARSEDGTSFDQVGSVGGMEWVLDVAPVGAEGWVAVGDGGKIVRSDDDGRSFTVVATVGFDLYGVAFADDLRGLAVGRAGAAFETLDGGLTWSDVSLGQDVRLSDVAFLPSGDALVAGQGGPWTWR